MVPTSKLRIAFTKDWLTSYGGSEEQLYQLHLLYPDAPIFTTVYDERRLPQFAGADIRTMRVPAFMRKGRRFEKLAPFMPRYFRSLDMSEFDVVVSVTSGFAKGIRTGSKTKHICICNTPLRIAWKFGGDDRGLASRILGRMLRRFDYESSKDVDLFLANSHNVAARIKQVYGRDSKVVYPPVNTQRYVSPRATKTTGFVTISRLVAYKRIDIAVEACTALHLPLIVAGEGPEKERLQAMAGPTITFAGFVDEVKKVQLCSEAKAFIFAADEDFGIAPVEAMAAGCPVIAYRSGGALETVRDGVSGTFFAEQTAASLQEALRNFSETDYKKEKIVAHAALFDVRHFIDSIQKEISNALSPGFNRL